MFGTWLGGCWGDFAGCLDRREGVVSASGPSREIVSFRSCVRAGGRAGGAREISCGYLGVFAG